MTLKNAASAVEDIDVSRVPLEPQLLIMVSLSDAPKHGYAMMLDIENMSGFSMRPGTLYAALARLVRRGLIEEIQTADYRRRPYRLTRAGAAELNESLTLLASVAAMGLQRLGNRASTLKKARRGS
jgi:DNA-binding PadR family transcriptional regulator